MSLFKLLPPSSSRQGLSASSLWTEYLGFSPVPAPGTMPAAVPRAAWHRQAQQGQSHHRSWPGIHGTTDFLEEPNPPCSRFFQPTSLQQQARAVKIQIHAALAGCFTVQSDAKCEYFLMAQAEPFSFNFNMQDNAFLASKPPISCAAPLRGIL